MDLISNAKGHIELEFDAFGINLCSTAYLILAALNISKWVLRSSTASYSPVYIVETRPSSLRQDKIVSFRLCQS
jgi:hypothetical protein